MNTNSSVLHFQLRKEHDQIVCYEIWGSWLLEDSSNYWLVKTMQLIGDLKPTCSWTISQKSHFGVVLQEMLWMVPFPGWTSIYNIKQKTLQKKPTLPKRSISLHSLNAKYIPRDRSLMVLSRRKTKKQKKTLIDAMLFLPLPNFLVPVSATNPSYQLDLKGKTLIIAVLWLLPLFFFFLNNHHVERDHLRREKKMFFMVC